MAEFVKVFADEYKWLEDINIEVIAGAPALYATHAGMRDKIALPNVSGGVSRLVSIMVAIASRAQSIALVDEIENGIYYEHQPALWKGLLKVLRSNAGQILAPSRQ